MTYNLFSNNNDLNNIQNVLFNNSLITIYSPARETYTERGGGPMSVSNAISGSVKCGVTIWGGDLGFVGGNVQEAGGGARVFPHTGHRSDGQAA